MDIEEKIKVLHAQINIAQALYNMKKPIYLSIDEYAPFGQNMMSTLAVAQYLNSFVRHADIVKMANYTLLTSLLGNDTKKGTFKTPLFHTFKLFSNNCLGNAVDTYVACDTFNTEKYKGIPYLDVTSVYSKESNTVYVNVVNRHKDKAISADVINTSGQLTGKAIAILISGEKLNEPFAFDQQTQFQGATKEINVKNNTLSCTFPPHSFTQIKLGVK